eukprot:TRINITY_DN2738_c0_g1_i1.p1 TRINITY_DN2738_c0_g1~~TRINITY_DN2738_c0_g1_i1.p1  ORF type:complete len:227 (+),score=21.45 TRINITY_DN2738_c0_g1_i1:77-757(+)
MQSLPQLGRLFNIGTFNLPLRAVQIPIYKMPTETVKHFNGTTTSQLESWLNSNGVDTQEWGTGPTKTVQELFEEVQLGETQLMLSEEGNVQRFVRIAIVDIKNDAGQTLMEFKQVLPNGHERQRGLMLSEKLLRDEEWEVGAKRGIQEELSTAMTDPQNFLSYLTFLPDSYRLKLEEKVSTSYGGLKSRYECNKVVANLTCIPQSGEFVTKEERPDGYLTTHWRWQ